MPGRKIRVKRKSRNGNAHDFIYATYSSNHFALDIHTGSGQRRIQKTYLPQARINVSANEKYLFK